MKQRKETYVTSAFNVDSIVTVYHFPMENYERSNAKSSDSGVVYDFWQLFYLEQGECSFEIDGQDVVLCRGQLVFCEPQKVRKTRYMRDSVVGIVSFRCQSDHMNSLKNTALTLTEDMKKNLTKLIKMGTEIFTWVSDTESYIGQEPKNGTSDHQLQIIKNRLELLLIDIFDSRIKHSGTVTITTNQQNYYQQQYAVIEAYLQNNLHRSLSVADLSAYTGLSANTIKRIYRSCIHSGIIHHFLTMKIEKAKQLIRDTEMNYTQISEMLGFSSIHYFSRLFKQLTGLSPKQYAQSVAKK